MTTLYTVVRVEDDLQSEQVAYPDENLRDSYFDSATASYPHLKFEKVDREATDEEEAVMQETRKKTDREAQTVTASDVGKVEDIL